MVRACVWKERNIGCCIVYIWMVNRKFGDVYELCSSERIQDSSQYIYSNRHDVDVDVAVNIVYEIWSNQQQQKMAWCKLNIKI